MIEASPSPLEPPTLELGLIGFSREQTTALASRLQAMQDAPVRWRLGPLDRADSWWVHGSRVQLLADGSLRVAPGDAGGRSVRLSLADVDRPLVFCRPIVCRELEPGLSVDLDDHDAVGRALHYIETRWLRGTVARLWLAQRIVACERQFRHRVYHLVHEGRLLAVLDRTGDVGLAPGASLPDLQAATWFGRPSSAAQIPAGFERSSVSLLLWTYALRSKLDHLPERYRSQRIFLRRPPKVPQRALGDEHLRVLSELARAPSGFGELQERLQVDADVLSSTLGALYLTGSVTVSPHRTKPALRPVAREPQEGIPSSQSAWALSGASRMHAMHSGAAHDPTVPVRLHAI